MRSLNILSLRGARRATKQSILTFLFIVLFQGACFAESFHYHIMQMGFKVGDADLTWGGPTVYKGKDTLLVLFKADGFNFLDEEKIYLDPASYKPLFVERDLNIFGSKERILEEYLTASGEIRVTKTAGGKTIHQTIKKAGAVDNIYGFIFRYRKGGSFKIGDEMDINLPTKDLKIAVVKKVDVSAAGKKYESFYMQSRPSKYKLWFDVSEKKLPLRISGAVGIANTAMIMTDYKE